MKTLRKFSWAVLCWLYRTFTFIATTFFLLVGMLVLYVVLYLYCNRDDLFKNDNYFNKYEAPEKGVYLYLNLEDVGNVTYIGPSVRNILSKAFGFYAREYVSITELRNLLTKAQEDNNIRGIFLNTDEANTEDFTINVVTQR